MKHCTLSSLPKSVKDCHGRLNELADSTYVHLTISRNCSQERFTRQEETIQLCPDLQAVHSSFGISEATIPVGDAIAGVKKWSTGQRSIAGRGQSTLVALDIAHT